MINEFTRKFYKSLIKIETSERMKPYIGEDRRQSQRLSYMADRYAEVVSIIDDIDNTAPNLRAALVRKVDKQMRKLE